MRGVTAENRNQIRKKGKRKRSRAAAGGRANKDRGGRHARPRETRGNGEQGRERGREGGREGQV